MNKNKVEFLGSYGSDEIIACSAWTSTSRDLTEEKRSRIQKLLDMLWSEGHETPFEKSLVHFLVDTDIATHIHLLKHRISSLNAESARYKELKEDKIYLPVDWEGQEVLDKWLNTLREASKINNKHYHKCLEELTPILGRSRAKESARFFKMYNSQIQADVCFNIRSFANFLRLRMSEHSQLEVRQLATEMYNYVKRLPQFQYTMEAIDAYTLGKKRI